VAQISSLDVCERSTKAKCRKLKVGPSFQL
jgi:hypothetical protein